MPNAETTNPVIGSAEEEVPEFAKSPKIPSGRKNRPSYLTGSWLSAI